ncbi:MAG: ABC transporter ATP-binding protein [Clostridiales bacterium]|nr:ABC transporter ATP-binding protein [Clostridiales bacterium]
MSIIELKNINFQYKGSKGGSLSNVNLNIEEGQTVLLCGASGSGKTSVIRLINGLIPHYYSGELEGEVSVAGHDIKKTELHELAGTVGTVFQNPRSQFFSVDTDGEIVFGPENIGLEPKEIKTRMNDVVAEMDLDEILGRSIFDLSGGQKQRIACASVAALLPNIILLDEPSSNLDFDSIELLRGIIMEWKRQGKTIVISEHRLWYLKDAVDRVIYMESGKIAKEWSGEEFTSLKEDEVKSYKLRPIVLEEELIRQIRGDYASAVCDVDNAIELKDFFFSYKKKTYLIMKKRFKESDGDLLNLNIPELKIPKGKVIGLVGPNGTGKSTFLRCLCGLEDDCKGRIVSDGVTYKGRQRLKLCYMVMQDVNHQLFTDSVKAEVMLSMKEADEKSCDEFLDMLGLIEYKDTHPMALSGGQKQRVAIASALASDAQILLFDEPTSGLDYSHMEKVSELLQQLASSGASVIVSTHDPELISECCDYVLGIKHGKVIYLKENRNIRNTRNMLTGAFRGFRENDLKLSF